MDSSTRPSQFVPAQVPGAVQLDWARAHDWPDLNFADNFKQYDGLEDFFWTYETTLQLPENTSDERTRLQYSFEAGRRSGRNGTFESIRQYGGR